MFTFQQKKVIIQILVVLRCQMKKILKSNGIEKHYVPQNHDATDSMKNVAFREYNAMKNITHSQASPPRPRPPGLAPQASPPRPRPQGLAPRASLPPCPHYQLALSYPTASSNVFAHKPCQQGSKLTKRPGLRPCQPALLTGPSFANRPPTSPTDIQVSTNMIINQFSYILSQKNTFI